MVHMEETVAKTGGPRAPRQPDEGTPGKPLGSGPRFPLPAHSENLRTFGNRISAALLTARFCDSGTYPIQCKLSQVTAYGSVVAPSRTSRPIDYYARSCGALLAAGHEAASGPCVTGILNSRRSTQDLRDLVVFVPLDVVKNERLFVSVRQLVDDPFQINAVIYATPAEVRSAHLHKRFGVLFAGRGSLTKRYRGMLLLANSHEHNVDGQPVATRWKSMIRREKFGSCGTTARRHPVSSLRCDGVAHHPQATAIHPAAV
jgi:hypothetical protein